jgi:aminopeptidase N
VHDFVWAADPDFTHDTYQVPDGPLLRFFYQKDQAYSPTWKEAQPLIGKAFDFLSKNFGAYPYAQYSIIQGGDGGMEYPMATLITGNRKLPSLVGVSIHEAAHSWYQGVLATNESLYCWMDEGFTSFIEDLAVNELAEKKATNPFAGAYKGYYFLVNSGKEQSLSTHADRFDSNQPYSIASYSKGEIFLSQLIYLIGKIDNENRGREHRRQVLSDPGKAESYAQMIKSPELLTLFRKKSIKYLAKRK